MNLKNLHTVALSLSVLALILTGCGKPVSNENREVSTQEYQLGTGDELRLVVFGHEELSGDFLVDSNGEVALPLVGSIQATGLTRPELETRIRDALHPEYLSDPKVSLEISEYRDIYVLGEVRTPGDYPYVPDMMVFQAVALAGGYTYRADENYAELMRQRGDKLVTIEVDAQTQVQPGDTVVIKRRWF